MSINRDSIKTINKEPRGFIALISAVIISAIIMVVVITGSMTGLYTRFAILEAEFKQRSASLAVACAEVLLLKLGEDTAYAGPTLNHPVGSDTCSILAAQNPGGTPRIFKVQGVFQHAYTTYELTVDVDTLVLSSWKEVAQ